VEFFDVKVVELTKGHSAAVCIKEICMRKSEHWYLLSADIVFNKYQYKYADILQQLSMLSDCT
jgi:hypothetical protein